jgi:hypothetical protein
MARVEHLTLVMYVGRAVQSKPQPVLWAALCVVAIMVARLFGRNLLHRDFSSGNILSARGLSFIKKNKWGALIIVDFVREVDAQPSKTPKRTRTLSHIAWALVNLLVNITPHYPWYDVETAFWYLYVGCLEVDRPGDYDKACQLTIEEAHEKITTVI